ncbi:MAG: ABC transporter ATP-binding protein [Chloroflexota bacterium]|nr:MAG: ABC transporter [Anaerolineaceae bacterium 4572_5.2]RLD08549.1 MAG: ABC transporter ATP-binding protein [Chloroflexota bacterium]
MTNHTQFEEEEFTTKFNGQTMLRIIRLITPHWPQLIGFLLAISIVSGLDSYFTYLSKRIIDEGIGAGNMEALKQIITQYGLLILIQAASVFCFIYLTGVLGERVRYDLRKKMFSHLQELSLSYYNQTPVGWIMSRVTSDSERVSQLVTWGLLDITWGTMNILTAAYFMFTINWKLAAIVFTIVPILLVVAAQFKKKIIIQYRQVRKINSKITGAYNENITGVRVAKAFSRENQNMQEFGQLTSEMYRAGYRAAWLSALFLPTVLIISALSLGSVVWYGGLQAQAGGMTIGGIQAFIGYITFMIWPIQDLARVYAEMQRAIASAERIFSLVDVVPEIADRDNASNPDNIQGDIIFDHVNFYYEEDDPVLENFDLHIKQGETIALVGPTGGGKTTIVNLLCRFFEPRHGSIKIAGHDYTKFTLHALQSRIGVVLQTPHLFSGTIRENIRYGKLEATNEEVEDAAKLAGAHDFITTLEKGYEEDVGEGGGLLSTGQKQLISLARAVLRKPDIFIMDEATSSVDTLTEALIQHGMENLMEGRTSFIIAHRLSTIKSADRILFIRDGAIAEAGSHTELLKAKGHYYRLYTQQFRNELAQKYGTHNLVGMVHNAS